MLLFFLVLAVLVGWLRGGKLLRFRYIRFRSLWFFVLALGLQVGLVLFGVEGNDFVLKYMKELYMLSYVLLFLGIIVNVTKRPILIILVGAIANALAYLNNGWKIPVSTEGLRMAGLSDLAGLVEKGKLALYTPLTDEMPYGALGQIITIPEPYPFPQVMSIGDMVIALGLFVLIQSIMLDDTLERQKGFAYRY